MKSDFPLVSVIVLCRNEKKFISSCLDSIIANNYPKNKLEVLVVDGMSEDGTREIVEKYEKEHSFIKMINNPMKNIPFASNEGIKNSNGDLVMRMSAHAMYEKDYIRKCVDASKKYNADNVVGIWKILPRGDGLIDKAIVLSLSSSFGAGNAKYRTGPFEEKKVEYVDTGAYGCYKKSVFKKVGMFNENLTRSEDMEFNLRLKKAGGKTILVPDAIVYYYARTDFKSFTKYNFINGIWAILPFKYSTTLPVSWRHLVPFAFVSSLIISAGLIYFLPVVLWLFLFILGLYSLLNIYFSGKIAIHKNDLRHLFLMPLTYVLLHLGYGLGSVWGLLKVIISRQFWRNLKTILKER